MSSVSGGSSAEPGAIGSGWRWLLAVAAIALLVAAAFVWFPASPKTVKSEQVQKTDVNVAPATKSKKNAASRTTRHTTSTTTTTVSGRITDASAAKPSGSEQRRSEPLTVALLAGALL